MDEPITALVDLPDAALLLILATLPPQSLARLCLVCKDMARLAHEEALWVAHCNTVRLPPVGSETSAKTCYARYIVQLCYECCRPTPYQFRLLPRRLCEVCETGHPHKYLLATAHQLMHTQSTFQQLSLAQQKALLLQLKSVEIKGYRWYLRASAIEQAEEVITGAGGTGAAAEARTAVEGAEDADTEDAEAEDAEAEEAESDSEAEAEREGNEVLEEWEQAAAEHSRQQTPKAAAKAERRLAQKENKKKSKLQAREKRQGRGTGEKPGEPSPSRNRGVPLSYAKKRASASNHRASAQRTDWEEKFAKLVALFGDGLAGLSGLELA